MRKSLLSGIAAFVLGTGTVFAGEESTVNGSVETSPPEMMISQDSLESGDVIYLIPMEVTEYYLVIPSQSSEMPG